MSLRKTWWDCLNGDMYKGPGNAWDSDHWILIINGHPADQGYLEICRKWPLNSLCVCNYIGMQKLACSSGNIELFDITRLVKTHSKQHIIHKTISDALQLTARLTQKVTSIKTLDRLYLTAGQALMPQNASAVVPVAGLHLTFCNQQKNYKYCKWLLCKWKQMS